MSRSASGTYCVDLPLKPNTGAVSVNPNGGEDPDNSILTLDLDPTSYVICPASAEAEISNVDASANALQNDDSAATSADRQTVPRNRGMKFGCRDGAGRFTYA